MIVAVIGLGTFGSKTAISLYEKGAEVIAIDINEALVDKIKDRVTHAVALNVTEERSLRSVNISDVDSAIVAIGDNIETSIMAVAMLRKLRGWASIARQLLTSMSMYYVKLGRVKLSKSKKKWGRLSLLRLLLLTFFNVTTLRQVTH